MFVLRFNKERHVMVDKVEFSVEGAFGSFYSTVVSPQIKKLRKAVISFFLMKKKVL